MTVAHWVNALANVTRATIVTDGALNMCSLDAGVNRLFDWMQHAGKTVLIGNGGSAAIASHMAVDFNLAGLRALALNDPVTLTSHANDTGVESIFARQVEWHLERGDILIALSCSGRSQNILDAVKVAQAAGIVAVTMTGFEPDNPLRLLGEQNYYVPSHNYGIVQLAHNAILHTLSDTAQGWEI